MGGIKGFWLCLVLCYALGAQAVVSGPKTYYGDKLGDLLKSPTMTGSEIKLHLHRILRSAHKVDPGGYDEILDRCSLRQCYRHQYIDYRRVRQILFGFIDLMEDDDGFIVRSFYCQEDFHSMDFDSYPPGPYQIPNYRVLNTEHLWPQSRFSEDYSKYLQKSDLHNLQPVKMFINSSRGNTIFGEVDSQVRSLCPGVFKGLQWGRPVFQPAVEQRGDIARGLFYFSIRYKLEMASQEEINLRKWHQADPVDRYERQRHEVISYIQHNRNPFIDHPRLVQRIDDF